MKISAVYKIVNTVTGDFYIGSSKDVKRRWRDHKCKSTWKEHPNNPMYLEMQKYGVDSFDFQILAESESEKLKQKEQQFIETLKPTYNSNRANGWDIEKCKKYQKEYQKEYRKSDKYKEYQQSDKCKKYQKEYQKEYQQSDKYKKYKKQYQNQLCLYNGEIIKLNTLRMRFYKAGIEHPTTEAKKYLIKKESKTPIEFYDIYP